MTKIDWEKERERLAHVYAEMSDGELTVAASALDSLTDVAREVLQKEMALRGTAWPGQEQDQKNPKGKIVMIRRYQHLPEAAVAKGVLDSAGIQNFLADENTIRMDWLWSNLLGGIKLLVREEDAETARVLLDESVPAEFEAGQLGCPKCGSLEVSRAEGWECKVCGNSWG